MPYTATSLGHWIKQQVRQHNALTITAGVSPWRPSHLGPHGSKSSYKFDYCLRFGDLDLVSAPVGTASQVLRVGLVSAGSAAFAFPTRWAKRLPLLAGQPGIEKTLYELSPGKSVPGLSQYNVGATQLSKLYTEANEDMDVWWKGIYCPTSVYAEYMPTNEIREVGRLLVRKFYSAIVERVVTTGNPPFLQYPEERMEAAKLLIPTLWVCEDSLQVLGTTKDELMNSYRFCVLGKRVQHITIISRIGNVIVAEMLGYTPTNVR